MAMSAALQRRRWLIIGGFNVYPNLYVILVTKPNGGKTMAINASLTVLKLLSAGKAPTLPDSVTRASMLDRLTEAFHSEDLDVWHGASLFVDELSILLHEYDRDLISHLSKLWDCPDVFEESRRHNVKQQVRLERPYLSIFAGVQPTVLGAILPEHAWQQGFCSRTIFAFSDEVIPFDTKIFNPEYSLPETLRNGAQALANRLEAMVQKRSRMDLTLDGRDELTRWTEAGFAPVPQHEKLADYAGRRWQQVLHIAIIRAAGGDRCSISAEDIRWARQLLEDTELGYQSMFLELRRPDDQDVIHTTHSWMLSKAMADEALGKVNGNPPGVMVRSTIYSFLVDRVAPHRVDSFFNAMVSAGWIEPIGPANMPDPWFRAKVKDPNAL
jgi:hypothetical protein